MPSAGYTPSYYSGDSAGYSSPSYNYYGGNSYVQNPGSYGYDTGSSYSNNNSELRPMPIPACSLCVHRFRLTVAFLAPSSLPAAC